MREITTPTIKAIRKTRDEILVDKYPETLVRVEIKCADGFAVPAAINRERLGKITGLSVPWWAEVLHDLYHKTTGQDKCVGVHYSEV